MPACTDEDAGRAAFASCGCIRSARWNVLRVPLPGSARQGMAAQPTVWLLIRRISERMRGSLLRANEGTCQVADVRKRLVKRLSATDVSEAKTNQDGLLVPKAWAADPDVLPALDTTQPTSDEPVEIISGTDGSSHILRFVYYGSKREYRLTWGGPLMTSLGGASAGDTFTLELADDGSITAHVRKPHRAWLVIASGDDRQYAGNDGYTDEPDSYYSWDSTVPNHGEVQVGDRIVLWDKHQLLGFSVVEQIESEPGTKVLRRCPDCGESRIKARTRLLPAYKCQECRAEFNQPTTDTKSITVYRSRHDAAWVEAMGTMTGAELRAICESPSSQHSMRALKWDDFAAALASKGFKKRLDDVEGRATSAHGGHRVVQTRVRTGQGKFRKDTLSRYGNACAVTGPAPASVLDAAHLYSFADVGVHLDQGGLMLRRDIHRLFDRGDLAINPQNDTVDVCAELKQFQGYAALFGKPLHVQLDAKQRQWVQDHWTQHRS